MWLCSPIATRGSMNAMSRNVENGSLSGEAEHWSRVLGYCINHRAALSMGRTDSSVVPFLEVKEE